MAFVQRQMNVTFQLGEGTFGTTGENTVELTNLRMSVKIIKAGGPSMSTLQAQVYGMTLDQMNALSTLGMMPTLRRRNIVTVQAGDEKNGMGTVFLGTITNAWMDAQGAPDTAFQVEAHVGLIEAVAPASPFSGTGATQVAVIMSSLANQMGIAFENNGVTAVLTDPYFYGSARDQVLACAEHAGINWIIDNNKLAIWPKGQARNGEAPLITADVMVNYPTYTSKGISVTTLFNPSIGYGGNINVQNAKGPDGNSLLPPADGTWIVYSLNYDLETQVPNGRWFTTIGASRPGLGPVVQ